MNKILDQMRNEFNRATCGKIIPVNMEIEADDLPMEKIKVQVKDNNDVEENESCTKLLTNRFVYCTNCI